MPLVIGEIRKLLTEMSNHLTPHQILEWSNQGELCERGIVDKLSRRLLGRSKHRREAGIIIKDQGGGGVRELD